MSDEENPIDSIRTRAMELFPEDANERDDYILGRMQRAGYKKGPGEWIRPEDDDEPQEDDDTPITRKEWRQMQREKAKTTSTATPPKVEKEKEPLKDKGKKNDGNPWWR
jgi:hypothetical protein